MGKGFTLLEVLIATAIMAMAFSVFIAISGRNLNVSNRAIKTTLSSILANNLIDECLYMGKDASNGNKTMLNYNLYFTENSTNLMSYRILSIQVGEKEEPLAEV
ncbi:MAG: prepilin-type N-terminal cleavage/methylation domain-containing protein [Nitrospiraceae bacterium]|nr:prepilin-type N-terminal cleavage/methylation domain-containing protein [Nitrospiraceae bacterium]